MSHGEAGEAVIKSADRSTCSQVAIRMKEINTAMESVDTTAEAFGIAIEEACEAVAEHITDGDKLTAHENTLMVMLKQAGSHTRGWGTDAHYCVERLEKFDRVNKKEATPKSPVRGASGGAGSWNVWKGDATLKPTVLNKDAVPCDRNSQRDFATYIKSGETATVKASANTVVVHMRVCIDLELNTAMRDLWIEEGPDTLKKNLECLETVFMKRFPLNKRRQMLLEAEQEGREVTLELLEKDEKNDFRGGG